MLWEAGALTCRGLVVALSPARGQRCCDRVGVRVVVVIAEIEVVLLPAGLVHAVASGVPARDVQPIVNDREAGPHFAAAAHEKAESPVSQPGLQKFAEATIIGVRAAQGSDRRCTSAATQRTYY